MFRRRNGEDIYDEEYKKYLEPHLNRFKIYMLDYIIPDMCAFYISSGYQLNAFYSDTFDAFINDVLAMLNCDYQLSNDLKEKIKKCLRIKCVGSYYGQYSDKNSERVIYES